MGYALTKVPSKPVLIVTYKGEVVAQDWLNMFEESIPMLEGVEGPIYRIGDFTNAKTSSFLEIVKMAKVASKGTPGSTSDPRIRTLAVGQNQWVSLGRTIFELPQFKNKRFAMFKTLDEALAYVDEQIAMESKDKIQVHE